MTGCKYLAWLKDTLLYLSSSEYLQITHVIFSLSGTTAFRPSSAWFPWFGSCLGFSYCSDFEFLGIGAEQGSGWATLEAILDAFRAASVGLVLILWFHN